MYFEIVGEIRKIPIIAAMEHHNREMHFVVCISNEGYRASLEVRKIYQAIPDAHAAEHRLVRVIDESGEDYLYPADYFMPIDLPEAVAEALSLAA